VRVGTAFLACPEARTHPDTSPTFSPPPAMTPR
jgi:NAD(P)H-dependent flavin oxidoreductase YrpB (nitropropane dioxygenase family)